MHYQGLTNYYHVLSNMTVTLPYITDTFSIIMIMNQYITKHYQNVTPVTISVCAGFCFCVCVCVCVSVCACACACVCVLVCATFVLLVLSVDVDKDSGVAAGHDQQGDDIERDKVEHVVEGLLPAPGEAAVCNALREVHPLRLQRPEYKQLEDKNVLWS